MSTQPTPDDYLLIPCLLVRDQEEACRLRNDEIVRLKQQHTELLAIAKEFVRRVEIGEVRSKKTYAAFKAVLDNMSQENPTQEPTHESQ